MSQATCTRCGRPLRNGVCPRGHPQRAARRAKKRRWGRTLLVPLLVLALLAAGLYAAFIWYPVTAARDVAVPASEGYAEAQTAYRTAVSSFPSAIDPAGLDEAAAEVREGTGQARTILAREQADLEAQEPPSIPVIDGRPPLRLAIRVRQRMLDFYIGALELVADLEGVSSYLAQIAPTLTRLDDLRTQIGNPRSPQAVDQAIAAARPISDQLFVDVEALSPPVELSALHESLRAITERVRASLEELDAVSGQGAPAIIASLVTEIGSQLDSFRSSLLAAPEEARTAGIGSRIQELDKQRERIAKGLRQLRDDHQLKVAVPES